MSKTKVAAIALALFVGLAPVLPAGSQQSEQDQQKAMEAYLKMMATNENHSHLGKFVGEWALTSKAWMAPGQDPATSQNTAQGEMLLGGRFLKLHYKGTMFGQPFEGLQIVGYDNMKKKFISFWIDSTSTAFYLTEGNLDQTGKIMTETGLWPDPMTGGSMKVKGVTKTIGPDEFSYELYMVGHDGKEFKTLENRCLRKK